MKQIRIPLTLTIVSTILLLIEYFRSPFGETAHQIFPSLFSCPTPEQISSLPPCMVYDIELMLILLGIILIGLLMIFKSKA